MAISFFQKISRAIVGRSRVDDDTLDAIEEALIESDMGVDTTLKVIDALEERVSKDSICLKTSSPRCFARRSKA